MLWALGGSKALILSSALLSFEKIGSWYVFCLCAFCGTCHGLTRSRSNLRSLKSMYSQQMSSSYRCWSHGTCYTFATLDEVDADYWYTVYAAFAAYDLGSTA